MEDELIATNPAASIRLVLPPRIDEPWTHLTQEEIAAVLATAPQPARTAYAVAIYSGARAGELIGLHGFDVNESAERPVRTVCHSHGGPTKGNRIRRVPLLAPAARALAELRAAVRPAPGDYVFPAARAGARATTSAGASAAEGSRA